MNEQKIRYIGAGIFVVISIPLIIDTILKVTDMHKLIPLFNIIYWFIVLAIFGVFVYVRVKKVFSKKKEINLLKEAIENGKGL